MRPIYKYYENILSKEECEYLINYSKNKLEQARTSDNQIPSIKLRNNQVAWINQDSGKECNDVVKKIVDLMFWECVNTHQQELNYVEQIQIAKYGMFQHYNKHIDIGTEGPYRLLSGVVELSDPKDYIGGGLDIFMGDKKYKVPFKQGTVVLFPSIITHRANPVFYGSRYSMSLWGHKK